ncbi:MAG: glycerol-3-phosphate dehydrogenase/oxidase [Thermomicrobiales bacterium]
MTRHIPTDIERERFDLIVIGAGINGTGIARDAAMRGLHVLVVDKGDIASGTTSESTRLIHGGLRYLQHREFGLVRESLRERELLLRNAPHLVRPMPTLFPIYTGAKRGPMVVRAGMALYDLLSYDRSLDRHHMMTRDQALMKAPGLEPAVLRAAALFFDAQAPFAERLAVENVISARDHGATILTYSRADRIMTEGAVVRGVSLTDILTGDILTARSKIVVNVAGPWVDLVLTGAPAAGDQPRLIGGTRGSHLVVAPFPGAPEVTLYFEAKADGRPMMVVPWNGFYLIGTTDIRDEGDPGEARAGDKEIAYLLDEANQLLPKAGLTVDDILYTFSGVRPLPFTPDGTTAAITRRHIIKNHAPKLRGLYSIIGGKLTTYRSLAEETVDQICDDLGVEATSPTAATPLPGAGDCSTIGRDLPAPMRQRLTSIYGSRARELLDLARESPDLLEPFCPDTGAIGAEIVFAAQQELATTLEDMLLRRTMAGLGPRMAIGADMAAAEVARCHLGWDQARAEREVAAYRAALDRFRPRALDEITTEQPSPDPAGQGYG